MKYDIIGSSSKGNSIIVEDILLLDCGVSYAKLKKYLSKIKLIFISHEHSDHLNKKTIKQIAYNYPTIKFLTASVGVVKTLALLKINYKNVFIPDWGKKYDLGALKIKLEPLYHDVDNYALHWKYKDKKGLYVVDTNRIDHIEAKNYDLYLIEANYKEDLLDYHLINCTDENVLYYLNRVPYTHLSWEKANDFLINNMGDNSEYQYIHQSNYNFIEEKENEENGNI